MKRQQGMSLAELAVVCFLLGLLMLIASQTLSSTTRSAALETERNLAQGKLEAILSQVGTSLLQSSPGGTAWLAPAPGGNGVLAIHEMAEGPFPAVTRWKKTWKCFRWESTSGRLWRQECPPNPTCPPPGEDRASALPLTILQQVAATANPQAVQMGTGVRQFEVSNLNRSLVRLKVSVEVDARHKLERVELTRQFYLRNH